MAQLLQINQTEAIAGREGERLRLWHEAVDLRGSTVIRTTQALPLTQDMIQQHLFKTNMVPILLPILEVHYSI